MEMLGIKVKQQVIEKLTNSIHQNSKTSEEYLVPLVLGKVKGAPSTVSFLNNNLNIRKIANDFIVISFYGEIIKLCKDETYRHVIEQRDPVGANVYKDTVILTFFDIVFKQEEVKVEQKEEEIVERPKTLFEQKVELYDQGKYDECYEVAEKELQEYVTKRSYTDIFDLTIQLLDLNAKRKKSYLNGKIVDSYLKYILEAPIDERERMQQLRNVGTAYMEIYDYENAEKAYRKALSLTNDEGKIEAILKELYQVMLRRQFDMEAFIASFYYKGSNKAQELLGSERVPDEYVAHDPIEATRSFQNAMADAYSRAQKIVGNNTSRPDYQELLWRSVAEILKKDYDIEWKSPYRLNPRNRL